MRNSRKYKVRNKDILHKIGVVSINENMEENQLQWFGSVDLQMHQFNE